MGVFVISGSTDRPPADGLSSNTKVSLFQAYATAVQPFQTILDNARAPNAFSAMAKLDQDKTCHLHYAADMTRALTDGLIEMEQVDACRGFVTAANLSESRVRVFVALNCNQNNHTNNISVPITLDRPHPSPRLAR